MPSTTATIETLTAEVRVLMVGSRQVTLSVYGQLDDTDPEAVEPFGRVRPGKDDPFRVHIVGRADDGNLVRSWLYSSRCYLESGYLWCGNTARPYDSAARERYRPDRAAEWDSLPLIVLAGLR